MADIEAKMPEEKLNAEDSKPAASVSKKDVVRPPEKAKRSSCQKLFDFW